MNATQPAAIVIDQWEILRLGVEKVLSDLDFLVVGGASREEEGVHLARSSVAEMIIVGRAPDLKRIRLLSATEREKGLGRRLDVIFLLDNASETEVSELMNKGASAVMMRSGPASELARAVRETRAGNRYLSPQLAPGSIGHLSPTGTDAAGLSRKELEVLAELATGATYDQIAARLVITKATVKTHLVHVYEKLGVANRNQAVAKAVNLGLLG